MVFWVAGASPEKLPRKVKKKIQSPSKIQIFLAWVEIQPLICPVVGLTKIWFNKQTNKQTNKAKQSKTKQTKQTKATQSKTKQNNAKQSKTSKTRQSKAKQSKAKQN